MVSATFSPLSGVLLVEFSGPLGTLGSLVSAEWQVDDISGDQWRIPSAWSVVSPNVLQVSGFSNTGAFGTSSRFRKTAGSAIPFANGTTITELPWQPVEIL